MGCSHLPSPSGTIAWYEKQWIIVISVGGWWPCFYAHEKCRWCFSSVGVGLLMLLICSWPKKWGGALPREVPPWPEMMGKMILFKKTRPPKSCRNFARDGEGRGGGVQRRRHGWPGAPGGGTGTRLPPVSLVILRVALVELNLIQGCFLRDVSS